MEKFFTILILLGAGCFASASQFDVNLELAVNDNTILSSNSIFVEGKSNTFTRETLSEKVIVKVTSAESSIYKFKGVLTTFEISYFDKVSMQNFNAKSQILGKNNESVRANVEISTDKNISIYTRARNIDKP